MRVIKARERLEKHAERQEIIKGMIEKYQDMRAAIMSCNAIQYDKPNIQTSPRDYLTDKIIELADYEKVIVNEQTKYNHEAEALHKEIMRLRNKNEREVLLRYYLRSESASDIGKALNINRTSVFRIMRRAEGNIDKLPRL